MPSTKDGANMLKRRHLGVAGALIALSQVALEWRSEVKTTELIENVTGRRFEQSELTREKEFVRKSEIDKIDKKLDIVTTEISNVSVRLAKLEGFLKARDQKKRGDFWSLSDFGECLVRNP